MVHRGSVRVPYCHHNLLGVEGFVEHNCFKTSLGKKENIFRWF
jgi:hypothetical protein